jgi:hypothetical protein
MWVILLLMILLWGITRVHEAYTEITPNIIQLTAQANQISVDQNRINILSNLIDHQSEQLDQINSIISTLQTQNNSP